MKNKIGSISGFVIGAIGFLVIFKITFLQQIPPEDELAPGMVVIIAIAFGVTSAFIGSWLKNYFGKERNV